MVICMDEQLRINIKKLLTEKTNIDRWSDKRLISELTKLSIKTQEEIINTGIDWKLVKKEIKKAELQENMYGEKEKCIYLGSVMSLAPSGKYYTWYANSNVNACKICNGKGLINNPYYNFKNYTIVVKERILLTNMYLNELSIIAKDWPGQILQRVAYLDRQIKKYNKTMTCPWCEDMGSREAMLDMKFFDLLDKEAEKYGFYITNGEGDPTDIIVCQLIEE